MKNWGESELFLQKICVVILAIFTMLTGVHVVQGFRIARPPVFTLPWTDSQMTQLNDYHASLWNLQNGEFNLDVVTTSKTGAQNGDIWILMTGITSTIQWKSNNIVYGIRADGY